ncbi:MAG: twin-arginine translocase TatA/TatE family subunit [Myxococcales bacterium]|nr:twin-arginine translocase TatA/TatE family subunit [Myxococcales bacterium]
MGCIGPQEGIVIVGIIVLVVGAGRLPQIGQALGASVLNFRKALSGKDEVDVTPREVASGDDQGNAPKGERVDKQEPE